mmetsp:Transcript_21461/g.64183  ORF Transcript_21461/g.64183 Transcript_21461/m.64183 type:complete len:254 (-) Transcript_21461:304-1065(-)
MGSAGAELVGGLLSGMAHHRAAAARAAARALDARGPDGRRASAALPHGSTRAKVALCGLLCVRVLDERCKTKARTGVALLVNASVVRVLLRITVDRAPDPHGPVHAACTTLLSRAYDADAQDGVVRAMVDELLASAPRCLRHTFTCDPPAFSAAMAYDPEASAALRRALVRGRRDPASPLSRKRLACMSCPSSASVTTLIEPDANIQCGESISLFSQNSSNCLRLPAAPTTPRRTTPSPRVATGGQQRLDPEV